MSIRHKTRLFSVPLVSAAFALLAITSGCGPTNAPKAAEQVAKTRTAADVLLAMAAAYRALESYADNAEYHQVLVERGDAIERTYPLQSLPVVFARPNKLRVSMQRTDAAGNIQFYAHILSDGNRVRHAVSDIPEQILESVAPLTTTVENFIASPDLREVVLPVAMEDIYPQLALLCADEDHPPPFVGDPSAKLLASDAVAGDRCFRVQLSSEAGQRELWIDEQTFLLKRMIIPSRLTKNKLDPNDELEKFVEKIEFNILETDQEIPAVAFLMEIPDAVKRVRKFVEPPPDPPHPLIGKEVEDFTLTQLDGQSLSRDDLMGQVTVLEFWFMGCAFCRQSMPRIDAIYEKYPDHSQVRFLAVSVDHEEVENQQLQERLQSWGTDMPIVRDTNRGQEAGRVLDVEGFPTTVLIGPAGRVHSYLFGEPDSYQPVADAIGELLAGKDIAGEALNAYRDEVARYQDRLAAVAVQGEPAGGSGITTERTLPTSFALEQIWTTTTVRRAGQLHLLPTAGEPAASAGALLVIDADGVLHELDAAGAVVRAKRIEPWGTGEAGFLLSGQSATGETLYLIGRQSAPQLAVLDADWQPRLVFPREQRQQIGDAALGDLDGDGQLDLLVGYGGDVGLQRVSLSGKRIWAARTVGPVLQVTLEPSTGSSSRRVYCVSADGTARVINAEGHPARLSLLADQAVLEVALTEFEPGGGIHRCALVITAGQRLAAVGIDEAGGEVWRQTLASANQPPITRSLVASRLPDGRGCWLVAAPDNTLHWLSADGQRLDEANYGQPIRALGSAEWNGSTVLVVATARDVTAWRVANRTSD